MTRDRDELRMLWKKGEKMTRQERMRGEILRHGLNLKRIFNVTDLGPVELCKKVHRLETKAHRYAEEECNCDVPEEVSEKRDNSILSSLDRILNFRAQGIPVFLNGDPRGYAIKIEDGYVREHNLEIYQDWGGYGIIAPPT